MSRASTYEIVQKVRCEAREAVKQELIAILLQSEYAHTQELGRDIAAGRLRPENLDFADIDDPRVHDLVVKYSEAAIAHEFQFTMSEGDNETANFTLKDPLTSGGIFTLNISGGHKRSRENVRNLVTADTLGDMFDTRSYETCARFPATGEKNWVYPITGSIGIAEVLHTFLLLSEEANLVSKGTKPGDKEIVRTLTDTLTFTTTINNLSFEPGATLTPTAQSISLTAASGKSTPDRSDEHQVVISLQVREPEKPTPMGAAKPRAAAFGDVGKSNAAEAGAVQELIRRRQEDFYEDQNAISDAFRDFLNQ
jgi:hypothetical protein